MSVNNNTLKQVSAEGTYYSTIAPTSGVSYKVGDTWYVTPLGTQADAPNSTAQYRFDGVQWIKTPGGSSTPLNPELVPVRDFKTQAQINALASGSPLPNDGTSYIVTDGSNKGNIATWDEATMSWIYFVPSNDDITTVTNPDIEANAGKWSYDLVTDNWVQISEGYELPTPSPQPSSANNIRLTRQAPYLSFKNGSGLFIVNDYVATYGDDNQFSAGDNTTNGNLPRKLSWNWSNLVDGLYAKSAQYVPKFVDASQTGNYAIALDHLGKVWAMGSQQVGTGMCTTPTGTTAVTRLPQYGLSPIGFFQANSSIVISKIYTSGVSYNIGGNAVSAALAQDGKLYVTGANGWGQLGDGTTTASTNWKQYPITNVKDVKLSGRGIFTLTATGELYYSGYKDTTFINGVTGNQTTPLLISTNVLDFDFGHHYGQNIYVVKNDNTLWVTGLNTNGQLGLGTLTNVVPLTQVTGLTNVKKVFGNKYDGVNAVILKTDGSISCAGNNRTGMLSYSGATAAANYSTFFTPAFAAQGTIVDVMVGYQVTTVMTASGAIWNAGQFQWRGLFHSTNVWADCNKFQQVPLPEAAIGMRGFHEVTNNFDGAYVLTTNYGIIGWGSITAVKANPNTSYCYSPRVISEMDTLNNGITPSDPPSLVFEKVGNIAGVTSNSVTDILDGSQNQQVTLTVNYTGGTFGVIDLTGSTLTGADISQVSLNTTQAFILGASGSFNITFTINATDIASLVVPNTQPQNYTLNLLINGQ